MFEEPEAASTDPGADEDIGLSRSGFFLYLKHTPKGLSSLYELEIRVRSKASRCGSLPMGSGG